MTVRYVKLWKLLLDKKMKRTDLIDIAHISGNVLARMGKDEYVALESLEKICRALKCDFGDIVEVSDERL
ncbi:MAG: helix-turn-helix transcriptional regulator [Fretibacterium sp.]|nr:helix-turn-helix transcriptional regulator [Fretibacterium sp.]